MNISTFLNDIIALILNTFALFLQFLISLFTLFITFIGGLLGLIT